MILWLKQNHCFWNAHSKVPHSRLLLTLAHSVRPARKAATTMTDYDTATGFLGEWGRFQQQVFFLLCLTIIPNGFTGLSIVFLADTPAHRCLIPAHVNLTAAWKNSSIPLEEDTQSGALAPSKCSRYKLEEIVSFSDRGLLPGVDVNLSNVATEDCLDGWEYDRSVYVSTIVTEVCIPALVLRSGGGCSCFHDEWEWLDMMVLPSTGNMQAQSMLLTEQADT